MTIAKYLVVDLETIPDLQAAETLIPGGKDMPDDLLRLELGKLYAKPGEPPETAFIKSVLHRIVAIGFQGLDQAGAPIEESAAICEPADFESKALASFDRMLEDRPVLVTFNGGSFDLPVIRYRALATATPMPNFLSATYPLAKSVIGPLDYFHRYGASHIDLMDRFSAFGAATKPSLAEMLALIGIQAKDGVSGADVERLAQVGDWGRIAQYVKRDVEMTATLFRSWLQICAPPKVEGASRRVGADARSSGDGWKRNYRG